MRRISNKKINNHLFRTHKITETIHSSHTSLRKDNVPRAYHKVDAISEPPKDSLWPHVRDLRTSSHNQNAYPSIENLQNITNSNW